MSSSKLIEKLKNYKIYSNDCIFFKLIFSENDLNDKNTSTNVFSPEYTHQIFGDDETIFGYKNLNINYYLTPGSLHAYIGLDYVDKITPQRFDGIESDDIYDAFQKFGCSPGFTRNLDTFCTNKLPLEYEFKPFGVKIHEYTRRNLPSSSKFEIFKVDSTCNEYHSQKFIDYLLRVETMLIFFIETANFTDTDDDQWTFYFLYEKRKHLDHERYITVGFLSVYNYYAFPDKVRLRVSQILIMPNYQHKGHGADMLSSVYTDACNNSKAIDITSESPSDDFIKVRDFVTCSMCMKLESYKNLKCKKFSPEMVAEALKVYKIPKLQSRRCYEILRLKDINEEKKDELKDYRLDIKKRLYIPFIRNKKCARNAGNVEIKSTTKTTTTTEIDESHGVTTIGFGNGSSSSSGALKTTEFSKKSALSSRMNGGNSSSSGSSNGFSSAKVSFDTSKPTMIIKNSSVCEDDEDEESEDEANTSLTNLYINEDDRKMYLEKQFQLIVEDYKSTIKRLDH
jgi:histone acetyltransferase 1